MLLDLRACEALQKVNTFCIGAQLIVSINMTHSFYFEKFQSCFLEELAKNYIS
jgi:hypothetical protein